MDWEDFVSNLSARDQAIIQFMIEGESGSAIARKLNATDSKIQISKRHLGTKIRELMGESILIDIQRKSNWKNSLTATKEKMACKYERSHSPLEILTPAPVSSLAALWLLEERRVWGLYELQGTSLFT